MSIRISDFSVLAFDCYGTLIDWERGLGSVLSGWASRRGRDLSREELLAAFAVAELEVEQAMPTLPYRDILRRVQGRLGEYFNLEVSREDADQLAQSVGDWPPFRDSRDALRRLAERYRLMVVSNVDRYSFAGSEQHLGIDFAAVVTAEEVGAYKPSHRMFEQAMRVARGWGVPPEGILHVAQSLFHDVVPAQALGLATVWVDRRAGRPGGATPVVDALSGSGPRPDLKVGSLGELIEIDDRQRAGLQG
jgi:2-haloalkanoic acid dehalogenase type II